MLTYLKRLLWDESAFIGLARGMLLALVSVMTMNGGELVIPQTRGQWSAVVLATIAGYLRSSSSPAASPTGEAQLAARSSGSIESPPLA